MPLHVAIDRRYWARGNYPSTRLLDDRQMRCCLGHLGRACGVPDSELEGHGTFFEVAQSGVLLVHPALTWALEYAEILHLTNAQQARDAMGVNDADLDNTDTRDELDLSNEGAREGRLIEIFRRHDVALTFFTGTTRNVDETHWGEHA